MMGLVSNFLLFICFVFFVLFFAMVAVCYSPKLYILFNKGQNVKVVFSLERQNKLIEHCHSGVGPSLTGQAQSAHFSHDKCWHC